MGQSESKVKGSYTFAYLDDHSIATTTIIKKRKDKSYNYTQDALLSHPELYALRSQYSFLPPSLSSSLPSTSSSSVTSLDCAMTSKKFPERPDSGYMSPSYDESMQLANDLDYIDSTYYPFTASESCLLADEEYTTTYKSCTEAAAKEEANRAHHILSFTDVMLASPDKTLHEVYLPGRSIYRLSPNMAMLTMIRKLDLSSNHLTELPESIGYMQNLEALSVAKNGIKSLPDTIGYLSNLLELDVSFNKLGQVTPCIGYLSKLKTLSFAFNRIKRLPTDVSGLVGLISLDLTGNPLAVLPAEVSKLPYLRRMRLEDCPFDGDLSYPLRHNAPSLVEICARTVIRKQIKIDHHPFLPQHMVDYIKSAKSCTSCHGPYYESYVLRGRLMEKTDVHIPLEYTLCSAHWSDADDRILSMFSAQPDTSSQVINMPYRPMLPCPPKQAKERMSIFTRRSRHASCSASAATTGATANTNTTSANLSNDSNIETEDRDSQSTPAAKIPLGHQSTQSSLAKLTSKLKRTSLAW